MSKQIRLISHKLCPYVQRVAIVLREKGINFERIDIDLSHKPTWFFGVSPLGKTPVLQIDHDTLFESAIICDFLDDAYLPQLHPTDYLIKAKHRAWIEFGSQLLNDIAKLYNADTDDELQRLVETINYRFRKVEDLLGELPYFYGEEFCMVDACWAPIFRYFDVFERIDNFGFFEGTPKVRRWRKELSKRLSVALAVSKDYEELLLAFLINKKTAISEKARRLIQAQMLET